MTPPAPSPRRPPGRQTRSTRREGRPPHRLGCAALGGVFRPPEPHPLPTPASRGDVWLCARSQTGSQRREVGRVRGKAPERKNTGGAPRCLLGVLPHPRSRPHLCTPPDSRTLHRPTGNRESRARVWRQRPLPRSPPSGPALGPEEGPREEQVSRCRTACSAPTPPPLSIRRYQATGDWVPPGVCRVPQSGPVACTPPVRTSPVRRYPHLVMHLHSPAVRRPTTLRANIGRVGSPSRSHAWQGRSKRS